MAGKAGAQRGISAKVLKHVLDHPGQYLRVEDMADLFECTEAQAAASITYVIREGKAPGLKSVQNGHVWIYEPEGNDEPKWALVHQNPAGKARQAILEDAEGNLWVAKPVDI